MEFTHVGFEQTKKQFTFPLQNTSEVIEIELEPDDSQLGEVVVSTTRSSRSI